MCGEKCECALAVFGTPYKQALSLSSGCFVCREHPGRQEQFHARENVAITKDF